MGIRLTPHRHELLLVPLRLRGERLLCALPLRLRLGLHPRLCPRGFLGRHVGRCLQLPSRLGLGARRLDRCREPRTLLVDRFSERLSVATRLAERGDVALELGTAPQHHLDRCRCRGQVDSVRPESRAFRARPCLVWAVWTLGLGISQAADEVLLGLLEPPDQGVALGQPELYSNAEGFLRRLECCRAVAQVLEAGTSVVKHCHELHRGPLGSLEQLASTVRHPQRVAVPPELVERDAETAHDLGGEDRLLGRTRQGSLHEAMCRFG